MTTPIRRLDGITYWVIEDPDEIYDFMNTQLVKEWIRDAKDEGRQLDEDTWLQGLPKRKWTLEALAVNGIILNPYEFVPRAGYNFERKLAYRRKRLRKSIENYGSVIWPITVRGEDMQLIDGHCRFTALRAMNISRIYAYVGRL